MTGLKRRERTVRRPRPQRQAAALLTTSRWETGKAQTAPGSPCGPAAFAGPLPPSWKAGTE